MKINRKSIKRTVIIFCSAFLLMLLGAGYAKWQWNRAVVTIVNGSDRTVEGAEISLDDGSRYVLGQLRPGQSRSIRVFPCGEAALRITFLSEARHTKKISPELYIEASGGYRPRLTIGKNDVVNCRYGGWLL